MYTIEIDFDVYKKLTMLRKSEDDTYSDVLRRELKLKPKAPAKSEEKSKGKPWVIGRVIFPHGTEFRATYKGQVFEGKVDNGALVVNNKRFSSPSAAAISITRNSVNGWRFWQCKILGKDFWEPIEQVRRFAF